MAWYMKMMAFHPYKTQTATAAALLMIGDLIQQSIEHRTALIQVLVVIVMSN